jgi:hypothetical protein
VARVGDCSWPPPGDYEGFLCLLRRSAKGNSSELRVSLSYLTCGLVLAVSNVWMWFVLHLLPPNHQVLVDTTGTSVPAST